MKLPIFFKPILWSYRFSSLDSKKQSETIITQTINYGDVSHWQWLSRVYGRRLIKRTLDQIPKTALRPTARRLAELYFRLPSTRYASRSSR